MLTHPQDLDAPLHVAARKKINNYRDQYASNRNITFMPAITSTSSRMHGEFLRLRTLSLTVFVKWGYKSQLNI